MDFNRILFGLAAVNMVIDLMVRLATAGHPFMIAFWLIGVLSWIAVSYKAIRGESMNWD